MKSFIVTGASASGKTTLINEAIKNGFMHLPTHTTRSPRVGEKPGIHNEYIGFKQFKANFEQGMYFEPSLQYAEKNGIYYGTPRDWLNCLKGENFCATPITPLIAKMICAQINVLWISLVCDDFIRRTRLMERGISEEEIEARLNTVEEQRILPPERVVFDTTFLLPSDIFNRLKEFNNAKIVSDFSGRNNIYKV